MLKYRKILFNESLCIVHIVFAGDMVQWSQKQLQIWIQKKYDLLLR